MNFSMSPGTKKTLNIVFTDNQTPPVQHPLGEVPTASDTTGVATVTPVGDQTKDDASFSWSIDVPAEAVVGSALTIHVRGVNPDGVEDVEDYNVDVVALDDTLQQATLT